MESYRFEGTPVSAYREPLLRALMELGGSAHKNKVFDRVGAIMKDTLTEDDYQENYEHFYNHRVRRGERIQWRQNAAWQRHKMVEEGLLKSTSPKGILEITEAGRLAFLEIMASNISSPETKQP
jgi:hypothetical protein